MNAAALPAGMRPFSLAAIAPEPWQNGGGFTRQIGAGLAAGRNEWVWRASVADLTRAGPFSVLAGIDRRSALVDSPPVILRSAAHELHFLRRGDAHAYDGATPWQAVLPAGPSRLFNLMTRRGSASACIRSHEGRATLDAAPFAVLLVAGGRFRLNWRPGVPGLDLQADEGLLLDGCPLSLQVEPLAAQACLLHAEIELPALAPHRQSAVRG